MGGGGGRRGQHERLAPTRKVWQLEKERDGSMVAPRREWVKRCCKVLIRHDEGVSGS